MNLMKPAVWIVLMLGLLLPACKQGEVTAPFKVKENRVQPLAEGVQLYMVKEGKGPKPAVTDKIKVNYHGMLADGTVFDSSFERGEPIVFPLNALIKGWQIGLVEVPVGSLVRLVLPPAVAYGDRQLETIPANSTLTFDIHLLSIETE